MKNESTNTNRQDVYSRITAQIVAELEKGVRPWVKPWNAEHAAGRITRPLRHNGQPYSGINVLSLWMSASAQNFAAPIWMTYRQASELKAHVRKGEKGSLVVYANAVTRRETDEKTGDQIDREIPYLKTYTVFNVEQIKDCRKSTTRKPRRHWTPSPASKSLNGSSQPPARISATAETAHSTASATDAVQMPPFESFRDADSYYGTLAHELTHWTSAKHRLDRDFGGHRFGSNAYAQEELVAELGSAFLCADLEIAIEPREENASYIANWVEILRTTAARSSPPRPTPNVPPTSSINSAPRRSRRPARHSPARYSPLWQGLPDNLAPRDPLCGREAAYGCILLIRF